ncbi:MAG TPA: 50S ribosomal protein L10 [Firmicutes bacterium]|nr:50S ribosomal protein L10 [Bacillota bacterium]
MVKGGATLLARPEKEATVNEIREKLERAQGVILTDYRGLDVRTMTELRRKLAESGIEYRVVKNTLASIAARGAGIGDLSQLLTGPTAMAFAYKDPVTAAKALSGFAKEHKELSFKGGILGKQVISGDQVGALAMLPPREVLLGQVVSAIQAPLSGLVNVLSATYRNLVYVLDAVRRQKEGA